MTTLVQRYVELILTERDLSWAFVGILYVLAAYFVRSWFMNPLSSSTRVLDKPYLQPLKSTYLKYSIWGWVFFFLPLGILIFLWRKDIFPVSLDSRLIVGFSVISYIFSIILHLEAFGLAAVAALKTVQDQKAKSLEA